LCMHLPASSEELLAEATERKAERSNKGAV